MSRAVVPQVQAPSGRKVFEDIARRIEAGETLSPIARKYAEEVLGRRILRGGRHAARPDRGDLVAGDRSFDDEAEVL